jgi:hypothetical protein
MIKYEVDDNMHKLSKDQQTIFFSNYIDFLLHDEIKDFPLKRKCLEDYKEEDKTKYKIVIRDTIEKKTLSERFREGRLQVTPCR